MVKKNCPNILALSIVALLYLLSATACNDVSLGSSDTPLPPLAITLPSEVPLTTVPPPDDDTNSPELTLCPTELAASKYTELSFASSFSWSLAAQELMEYHLAESREFGLYPSISVIYYDLTDEEGYSYGDPHQLYWAASTVKVPIALGVGMAIAAEELSWDTTILYNPNNDSDPYGVNYLTDSEIISGATVKALLYNMLVYSCNTSTNMLEKLFEGEMAHQEYMASIGYPLLSPPAQYQLTPEQSLMVFYDLYRHRLDPFYSHILNLLAQTTYHLRLDRLLPLEVKVSHKYGDVVESCHDVGIIWDDKPYILLVYSDQLANPDTFMAELSLLIYEGRR
ncbi:MAG: class A beta-lactamase-related serine hydrolase [Symbiobacteriaceae bacterium]|nr:class A beta-lactamase-related serine hydrolase [Symbiobacteriaceae bacterium]